MRPRREKELVVLQGAVIRHISDQAKNIFLNVRDNSLIKTDEHSAGCFDKQREKLSPIKDALHLCIRIIFSNLPEDSHMLCIGAGTGSELLYLAEAFPKWHFTAVDPSKDMLSQCRQRVKDHGYDTRCSFYTADLESFSATERYDAATSILVSHYTGDLKDREKYFSKISSLLKPDAILVNADLSSDISAGNFEKLLEEWGKMQRYSGMSVNLDSFRKTTTIAPRSEIERILQSCGFTAPTLFFQNLFIYAWFSCMESH